MSKKRKAVIAGNDVSEMYTFLLGGYEQKVLIEGKSKELPVVITLHGGPGTPIPFSAGCRGMFPEFTDNFLMVYWDQLGCGINDYKIDERFTVDSFVNMTLDLIKEVKKLFPQNLLCLFSMSWGSILSAKVLEKAGTPVDGVVVWGQIIKEVFFSEEVFHVLETSKLPSEKMERIKGIDRKNFSSKDMELLSGSIRKYTYGYVNKKGKKAPMGSMIYSLFTSPDYTFRDFKAVVLNGYQGNTALWKEILAMDLSEVLTSVKIPYVMIQGDTDIVASTKAARELSEQSENDFLKCRIVGNSGHLPGSEGMEAVLDALKSLCGNERGKL